jgi:hypothetical protein
MQLSQKCELQLGGDDEADFYVDSALNTRLDGVYTRTLLPEGLVWLKQHRVEDGWITCFVYNAGGWWLAYYTETTTPSLAAKLMRPRPQFPGSNPTVPNKHIPFETGESVAFLSDTGEYLAAVSGQDYAIGSTTPHLWYVGTGPRNNHVTLKHVATGRYLSADWESVANGYAYSLQPSDDTDEQFSIEHGDTGFQLKSAISGGYVALCNGVVRDSNRYGACQTRWNVAPKREAVEVEMIKLISSNLKSPRHRLYSNDHTVEVYKLGDFSKYRLILCKDCGAHVSANRNLEHRVSALCEEPAMSKHPRCACFLPDSEYQKKATEKEENLRLPRNTLDADPTCISQDCQLSDLKPIASRGHNCPGIHSCIASIENSGTISAESVSLSCSTHYQTTETKNDNTAEKQKTAEKQAEGNQKSSHKVWLGFVLVVLVVLVALLWVLLKKKMW